MNPSFAIIGCGRIAERHAEQIITRGRLIAVCDIVPEKADKLAKQYQAKAYYSLETLLQSNPDIEVICICTPNGLHASQSIMALEAGHHVLCEKPLCIDVEAGKQMISASIKADKKLFVVKQNRYNPPVVFLKELIGKGLLGTIYSFQVNCFWNRPGSYYHDWKGTRELDGGTLFTQFSHFIDLIYWLLDDVRSVEVQGKNFAHPAIDFEDTGIILFDMENGAIGTMNYTVNSFEQNMEGSFTVFGENGTVKIGGQYLNELEYCRVKGIEKPDLPAGNTANGYGFYQGSMSNHDQVYQHLMAALQSDNHLLADAAAGLKTVEIIEHIYSKL